MIKVSIYLPDIKTSAKYLCDDENKCDLVGQLLFSLGHFPQPRMILPSQLEVSIPPLTVMVRGRILDSAIAIQLLRNSNLPPREQIERANRLLKPFNMELEGVMELPEEIAEKVLERKAREAKREEFKGRGGEGLPPLPKRRSESVAIKERPRPVGITTVRTVSPNPVLRLHILECEACHTQFSDQEQLLNDSVCPGCNRAISNP